MARERVLGYTVVVTDGALMKTYPAGTSEFDIQDDHLSQITNPRAWESRDGVEEIEIESIPQSLDDCNIEQLREIARLNDISLGQMRSEDRIREVLRTAGVGVSEGI